MKLSMKVPKTIPSSLAALALFVAVGLVPSLATAVPSTDKIERGGHAVKIHFGGHTHFVGSAVLGGSFTYFSDTKRLSGRSAVVDGHEIDLSDRGRVRRVRGKKVSLMVRGLSVPDDMVLDLLAAESPSMSLYVIAHRLDSLEERRGGPIPVTPTSPVPEPTAALLFAVGIVTISRASRQRTIR